MCVCVCDGEVTASISSLANWCMVHALYIYNYTFSNVQMYSLGMLYTPSQAPNTLVIDFMLSVSASSVAAPSDRLLLGLKE